MSLIISMYLTISMYLLLKLSCNYINKNDEDVNLDISLKKQIIISTIVCFFLFFVYLRYGASIKFFKYSGAIQILALIAYIDYKTQNVYLFTSKILLFYCLIFFLLDIKLIDLKIVVVNISITYIICKILNKIKAFSEGDTEVFVILSLVINGLAIINIFTSILISGICSIVLFLFKKFKLKSRIALCPSILFSTFFIILFFM